MKRFSSRLEWLISPASKKCFAAMILLAVLTAGCSPTPVVRGDTERNFRKSFEEVARQSQHGKMELLDDALRSIILCRAISSTFERHSYFDNFTDAVPVIQAFVSPLQDWREKRASIVVARIGRMIDGKTVDEIIDLGIRETAALNVRMARWAAQQASAPDIDWIQPAAQQRRINPTDRSALDQVHVSGTVASTTEFADGPRPTISFIIENRSDQPVKALMLTNALMSADGVVESADMLHYALPAPVAPGGLRRITTSNNVPASFSRDITVIGVEYATGKRVGITSISPGSPVQARSVAEVATMGAPLSVLRVLSR